MASCETPSSLMGCETGRFAHVGQHRTPFSIYKHHNISKHKQHQWRTLNLCFRISGICTFCLTRGSTQTFFFLVSLPPTLLPSSTFFSSVAASQCPSLMRHNYHKAHCSCSCCAGLHRTLKPFCVDSILSCTWR